MLIDKNHACDQIMHVQRCIWVKLCSYNITNHLTSKLKFQLKFNAINFIPINSDITEHACICINILFLTTRQESGVKSTSCYRIVTSVYECCIVSILTGSVIIQLMSDRQLTVNTDCLNRLTVKCFANYSLFLTVTDAVKPTYRLVLTVGGRTAASLVPIRKNITLCVRSNMAVEESHTICKGPEKEIKNEEIEVLFEYKGFRKACKATLSTLCLCIQQQLRSVGELEATVSIAGSEGDEQACTFLLQRWSHKWKAFVNVVVFLRY